MKKTYTKPSLSLIELGSEAMMVSVTSNDKTRGWGTNGSTRSAEPESPWASESWTAAEGDED